MFAIYAMLDGFDMGVGIVYLVAARTDAERGMLLGSIGPVWDGNEVWLIAGGGTLFFAFPSAYASGFSGFYLPLMMVLWLLILRGTAVEFRNHITSPVWTPFWDVVFAGASTLLALLFGVALGNVLRGVPTDAGGNFFLPLWTNFRLGPANKRTLPARHRIGPEQRVPLRLAPQTRSLSLGHWTRSASASIARTALSSKSFEVRSLGHST